MPLLYVFKMLFEFTFLLRIKLNQVIIIYTLAIMCRDMDDSKGIDEDVALTLY
jgi:hypothetical protein